LYNATFVFKIFTTQTTTKLTIALLSNQTSMQISLKSVQTFELSHSHRNTQTHGLYALYKHVHLVGPTESQHSLLFYKSYTQHGTNVARERTQDS